MDVSRTALPFERDITEPGYGGVSGLTVEFNTPTPFATVLGAFRSLGIASPPASLQQENLTREAQLKVITENAAELMQLMSMAYRCVTFEDIAARAKKGAWNATAETRVAEAVKHCQNLCALGNASNTNASVLGWVRDFTFEVFRYRPLPPVEPPQSWRSTADNKGVKLGPRDSCTRVILVRRKGGKWCIETEAPWSALRVKPKGVEVSKLGRLLHVFSGESGSGKTVTALASAQEAMRLHESSGPAVSPDDCDLCILVTGVSDADVGFVGTSTADRNERVATFLEDLCCWIVQDLNVAEQGSERVRVTLVFDECGAAQKFRRGLCALHGRFKDSPSVKDVLSCKLPLALRCKKVFVMAAGTGSELVIDQVGSLPETFDIHRVDCNEGLISHVHHLLIEHVRQCAEKEHRDTMPVFAANLRSLASFVEYAVRVCVTEEDKHPAAKHIGRLMRNLRIASLFVTSCVDCPLAHMLRLVLVDWREVAPDFMRGVLVEFKCTNGLKNLSGADLQQILLDTVGYALGGPGQQLSKDSTKLVFQYGLLTDNALLLPPPGASAGAAAPPMSADSATRADPADLILAPMTDDRSGAAYMPVLPKAHSTRYRMSSAVAEMALRGFGSAARPSDSFGFEDTVRDFLMMHMMGACSRVGKIAVDILDRAIPSAAAAHQQTAIIPVPRPSAHLRALRHSGEPMRPLPQWPSAAYLQQQPQRRRWRRSCNGVRTVVGWAAASPAVLRNECAPAPPTAVHSCLSADEG